MERLDIKENSISAKEEDKKFVSQAVKFVVGHTRKGFVSLCASVATLLKEKDNLKLENEFLRRQIEELKQSSIRKACNSNKKLTFTFEEIKNFKFKRKVHFKTYKAIKGCLCNNCTGRMLDSEEALTPPLENGDRVVISGEICGSVAYLGHVDELEFPEIFVGLHLDEAVGDNNGTIKNKTYFKVPHHYGYFVPLSRIRCIIN